MQKHSKKNRIISKVLLASMIFSLAPSESLAAEENLNGKYQMVSEPEVVYENKLISGKRSQNFNEGWKFYLGDQGNAESSTFNDSSWRNINLPHDYSIEQDYDKKMEAESAYLPGGTAWYRKTFFVDSSYKGKVVNLDFDGVYMNASIYINGKKLGMHPYGYTPFSFNLTDYLNYNGENTIAVKVEHKTPSSRWYSGSGIYRDAELRVTDPIHIDKDGIKIEAKNLKAANNQEVDLEIKTVVNNYLKSNSKIVLEHKLIDKSSKKELAKTIDKDIELGKNKELKLTSKLSCSNPKLWSVNSPNLYELITEIKVDGKVIDTVTTDYGFRTIDYNPEDGFYLNGEKTKLKGVCMHHDQGALGAKSYHDAIERQVDILKDMGANAIRVTHNPASKNLIDIANKKGILIIEEAFDGLDKLKNGNLNDYSVWFNKTIGKDNLINGKKDEMTWSEFDLTSMIKRGQNSPAIIMWSLGNEISEGTSSGMGHFIEPVNKLIEVASSLDSTRPVTTGDNKLKGGDPNSQIIGDNLTKANGIVGLNYCSGGNYDSIHKSNPNWSIVASETASAINSRGIYDRLSGGDRTSDKQLTSYDNSKVGWGAMASESWYEIATRDFIMGEFIWTGFDYLGEPTPWNGIGSGNQGEWPSPKSSYFGIIDTAGFPKDTYYFYQSQWNKDVNTLHILPAWNEDVVYKNSENEVEVVVYSDASKVELLFTPENGSKTSLGIKEFSKEKTKGGYEYQIYKGEDKSSIEHKNLYLEWKVPYQAGKLEAIGYDENGKQIEKTQGRSVVETTGQANQLTMNPNKKQVQANNKDLIYLEVDVRDSKGNIVPNADNRVTFKVDGPGELVGVDNGSSPDHDSFLSDNRKAFSGKVLAIVKSTDRPGKITVTASADGLKSTSISVSSLGEIKEKDVDHYEYSKNYYVAVGHEPLLEKTIKVIYNDGSIVEENIKWDKLNKNEIEKEGSFTLIGRSKTNKNISITVNMVDKIGGIQNVSLTTGLGMLPRLPEKRPAISKEGKILDINFDVVWETINPSLVNKPGIVEIKGKSLVFGEEFDVIASVRVQEEKITIGSNIAPQASLLQNLSEDNQSDSLEAIIDGSKTVSENSSGGPNPSLWTNYKASQNGINTAEITFKYATQQRIGKSTIYFYKDGHSARYPDINTTEFYISESGYDGDWKKVKTEEVVGKENGNVIAYTYSFDPFLATYVKVKVTNKNEVLNNVKPCIGIAELELNTITSKFEINNTTDIESLVVNGYKLTSNDLKLNEYNTESLKANIDIKTSDNSSVNILPVYDNKVKILIESENYEKIRVFTINLGKESILEDGDARYDVDVKSTSIEVADEQSPQDKKENALDGNTSTLWHTQWSKKVEDDERWVTLILDKPTKVEALRYYARDNQSNGRIGQYEVYVSDDNIEWVKVTSGSWDTSKGGWRIAKFSPVTAKYIKLNSLTSAGDGDQANKFVSAAELRVRKNVEKTDISKLDINIEEKVIVEKIKDDMRTNITIKDGDKTLEELVDYTLSFENNNKAGKAKVVIQGIADYIGKIEKEYEIILKVTEPEKPVEPTEPTEPEKPTSEKYIYTKASSNIRDAETNEVIGKYEKGKYINGEIKGNYIYFTYQGKLAKMHLSRIIEASPEELYISKTVNIRDSKGQVLGKIQPGKKIKAVKIGNYYRYWDKGEKFVWHTFVTKDGIKVGSYIKGQSNIRDAKTNEIIGNYGLGKYIGGELKGSYIYFNYNGRPAKVHVSRVVIDYPRTYTVTRTVNIRNNKNKVVGKLSPGKEIKGVKIGNYYRYWDKGEKIVWHTFVK